MEHWCDDRGRFGLGQARRDGTDANGCTTTNSFTLTEPVILASSGVPATFSCGYNVTCNGAPTAASTSQPRAAAHLMRSFGARVQPPRTFRPWVQALTA
ncbi:MAG: hypothetical protein IPP17_19550 [Bacteroidetes bacterium]|nr:hypothetical protein [Bacteroidota bacterium]